MKIEWIDSVFSAPYQMAKVCGQGQREADRGGFQCDAEIIDEVVRHKRADNADQNHRRPIDARHITFLRKLEPERDNEDGRHQNGGDRQAETQVDRQIVRSGFAHGDGHELDEPEFHGDFGNPVFRNGRGSGLCHRRTPIKRGRVTCP